MRNQLMGSLIKQIVLPPKTTICNIHILVTSFLDKGDHVLCFQQLLSICRSRISNLIDLSTTSYKCLIILISVFFFMVTLIFGNLQNAPRTYSGQLWPNNIVHYATGIKFLLRYMGYINR